MTSKVGPTTIRPRWRQIEVAVLLAGTIPITLGMIIHTLLDVVSAQSLWVGLYYAVFIIYLLLVFLFHLITFPFGFWAGVAWPGRHFRGNATLALVVGVVEVATGVALSNALANYAEPLVPIDYLFVLGTVSLFLAGALFADVCETIGGWLNSKEVQQEVQHIRTFWSKRTLDYIYSVVHHETNRPGATEEPIHTTPSSQPTKPSEWTVLIFQTFVPSFFLLTGTIITAVATWVKSS